MNKMVQILIGTSGLKALHLLCWRRSFNEEKDREKKKNVREKIGISLFVSGLPMSPTDHL